MPECVVCGDVILSGTVCVGCQAWQDHYESMTDEEWAAEQARMDAYAAYPGDLWL